MKRLLYACLSLATLLAGPRLGAAQGLTNLNLDSWVTRGTVEKPANWLTTDDDYAFYYHQPTGTFNFGTVTKTTDRHGGTFAAKLTTTPVQGQNGLVPGELILGAKTGMYQDPFFGFPLAGGPLAARPTALQFYYKTTGAAAADSAFVFTYVSRTVNGVPTLVGAGSKLLAPASNYRVETVPFTYDPSSSATPDSVHIVFGTGIADIITSGTSVFIDDVTFTGVTLATRADASVQDQLTVAPNPSPGGRFVISSPAKPELAGAPLQVLDLAGRTVLRQPASSPAGRRELDLSNLSAGIYMLRLDTKDGTIVRPLSVK